MTVQLLWMVPDFANSNNENNQILTTHFYQHEIVIYINTWLSNIIWAGYWKLQSMKKLKLAVMGGGGGG